MASKLNPREWEPDIVGALVTWLITTAALIAFSVIAGSYARGSDCHQFFAHRKQAVQQVVAYAAPVYYQAGVNIENDALAEKVARIVVAKLQVVQQVKQQQTAPQSAIAQHCAKCHSGATPKAGIVYDGATSLDCWQVTSALRAIRDNTMPKDHKIAPEVKGAIMEELLSLEQPADRPQRVEVPPPLPSGELK